MTPLAESRRPRASSRGAGRGAAGGAMEGKIEIEMASCLDLPELVDIWESAVRATHHFLPEEEIRFFRRLVRDEFLPEMDLKIVRCEVGLIAGFVGVLDGKVEMLFVRPAFRGRGIGKALLEYALTRLHARTLDVNEQNDQAIGFYRRMGFLVEGRSALDGAGKPFPILHMRHAPQDERARAS